MLHLVKEGHLVAFLTPAGLSRESLAKLEYEARAAFSRSTHARGVDI